MAELSRPEAAPSRAFYSLLSGKLGISNLRSGEDLASLPPATRAAGDQWLSSGRTALLRVPSVIVPATWNVLLNPRHPESRQVRVIRVHLHTLDPRLL
jgi:RES domain-containing protein